MQRALTVSLGALMVAGSAAPVSAAAHFDFTGYYRIMYMSETNTGHGRESASFTDSYFQDRLNLELTFSPTDEISVYWRLRGPSSYRRWGGGDKTLETHFIFGEIKQDWGRLLVGRLSDDLDVYGLASLGYQPATAPIYTNVGPFERADVLDGVRYSYGWDNGFSVMAQYGKIDNNSQSGGSISSDPAGIRNGYSDQDWDQYRVEVIYAWDDGGAGLGLFYDRNATRQSGRNGNYNPYGTQGWGQQYGWVTSDAARYPLTLNKIETWGLNPSMMHSWGDFSIHFEGMAAWGQAESVYRNAVARGATTTDGQGYGAYVDFDYNYGPGNATLAGWWVSGTDVDEMYKRAPESKSIADLVGGNFYPLLVAYNGVNIYQGESRYYGNAGRHVSAVGFANNGYENYVFGGHMRQLYASGTFNDKGAFWSLNTNAAGNFIDLNESALPANAGRFFNQVLDSSRTRTMSFNNDTDANHWAVALTGNHALTDDISMHYGLAYLALNQPNYRVAKNASFEATRPAGSEWQVGGYTTQNKDLGFEVDLGFTFLLLDNLKFTTAVGYMFNGDAYKQLRGYNINQVSSANAALVSGDSISARWSDADDSYVWFNSLSFIF